MLAFQGTVPFSVFGSNSVSGTVQAQLQSTNASVITVNQGSVATVIVGGSIAASFTPPANQSVSGTVQTDVRGSVATVIIGGSIAASFTPPANQSVSGTVGASLIGLSPVSVSNFPTTQNVSGSVVAFQGTNPFIITGSVQGSFAAPANQSVSGTVDIRNLPSIYGNISGSVAATVVNTVTVVSSISGGIFPISGSVAAVITNFPANQSVSGTLLVNNGSVVAFQGGAPWTNTNVGSVITTSQGSIATVIIGGSIAASFTPPANQSVSGTVQTDVRGSVATVIIGGSIAASFTPPANQSVSGTVGASVIGTVPVVQSGAWTQSVIGTYSDSTVSSTVTGIPMMFKANVSSSIMQAISPQFPLPVSVQGTLNISGNPSISGTVLVNNGSVVSFQGGAWSTSVMTNVITSIATAGQVMGSVAALQATNPWNIAGSVAAFQAGTQITSLVSTIPSSVLVGASLFGQLPAGTAMIGSIAAYQGSVPWVITGSVQGSFSPASNQSVSGVVMAQGLNAPVASVTGNPVYTGGTDQNGSIAAFKLGSGREQIVTGSIQGTVSVLGTVPVTQSGAWASSIIGGASVFQTGTWNVSVLGTTPSSLLTGNYSQRNDAVSSFLGGNLTWNPVSTDSAGRLLIKPFASEDATIISYVGSVVSGSVQLIQASAIGKRSYITDFWLSNTGAATTLVTFQGGDTSLVGQFIAPTGGGMSSPGIAVPLKTTLSQDLAFKVSTATSVLYVSLKGYQAP